MVAGMAFPRIFKYLILSWLVYKLLMAAIKHSPFWQQVWHKPLFAFSVYVLCLSLLYYGGQG